MRRIEGIAVMDRAQVLGFTVGFCFLPSALCLMGFFLLTYYERHVR